MWDRIKKFLTTPDPVYTPPAAPKKPPTPRTPQTITRAEYTARVMARAQLFAGFGNRAGAMHLVMAEKTAKKELADEGIRVAMNGSFENTVSGCNQCDRDTASEAGGWGKI